MRTRTSSAQRKRQNASKPHARKRSVFDLLGWGSLTALLLGIALTLSVAVAEEAVGSDDGLTEEAGEATPRDADEERVELETIRFDEDGRPWPKSTRPAPPSEPQQGAVVPITGTIDKGLYEHVKRRSAEAIEAGATVIVYEFDTPGGAVAAMMQITEAIEEVREQDVLTVAWVPKEAISAGALIAFSCDYVALTDGARIGDAQPIMMTAEGYVVGGEKVQSYMRSVVEEMAARNGYPRALIQAMITQEIEVIEIEPEDPEDWKLLDGTRFDSAYVIRHEFENWEAHRERFNIIRTVVHGVMGEGDDEGGIMGTTIARGEIATFTGTEARNLGLAMQDVRSFGDLERAFHIGEQHGLGPNLEYEISWSVQLVRWLQAAGPIFIMIGLIGLYLEFQTPGFGLGGIVALVAFGIYFSSGMLIGLAESWHILVFLLGIGLILVEVFVLPGFGIPGALGLIMVVVGLVLAGQDFVWPETSYQWDQMTANLVSLLLAFLGAIVGMIIVAKVLPHVPVLNRMILKAEARKKAQAAMPHAGPTDEGLMAAATKGGHPLLGAIGVATTELRPAGKARFGDEVADVVAKGRWLEQGQRVVVTEFSGNRLVVKAVDPPQAPFV